LHDAQQKEDKMKILEIVAETTTSGCVATVANPGTAHSKKKPKKVNPTDNALDMKGSIFGEEKVKR